MKKLLTTTILTLSLASCATKEFSPDIAGKRPTDSETIAIVKDHITTTYMDDNVKNLRIKKPIQGSVLKQYGLYNKPESGWVICYQANGKNAFGGYTGVKQYTLGIQHKEVIDEGYYGDGRSKLCKQSEYIK